MLSFCLSLAKELEKIGMNGMTNHILVSSAYLSKQMEHPLCTFTKSYRISFNSNLEFITYTRWKTSFIFSKKLHTYQKYTFHQQDQSKYRWSSLLINLINSHINGLFHWSILSNPTSNTQFHIPIYLVTTQHLEAIKIHLWQGQNLLLAGGST